MVKPQIILCADDYAQNNAISNGILELVASNRLTAVSCMTTTLEWGKCAGMLKAYEQKIDIGLHFNLTHGTLLTQAAIPHRHLLQQSLMRKIDMQLIIDELTAQLERFIEFMHRPPDFIDGHQHIQHLPVVRDALLNVILKKFKSKKPYVRVTSINNFSSFLQNPNKLKQLIIHLTGANNLREQLQKNNILHNLAFAGIYDFDLQRNYAEIFKQFLATVKGPTLIMCHPGNISDDIEDTIRNSRPNELAYFNSQQFKDDMTTFKVQLCRFQDSI